jgi:hypothetical protein
MIIDSTIKLIAKFRKLHLEWLEKREHGLLKQMFALLPKVENQIKDFSQANTPYKWKDRFVQVSSEYIEDFKATFQKKGHGSNIAQSSQSIDNALAWLFENIPELKE